MSATQDTGVRSRMSEKTSQTASKTEHPYDADKNKNAGEIVGFSKLNQLHWFGIIVYFFVIYLLCLTLDNKFPPALTSEEAGDVRFSEERAKLHVYALTAFGPRPAGSDALENLGRNYILNEIEKIRLRMKGNHRMDMDIQKPSGCYELQNKYNATYCYKNLTNIIVRLGRKADRPSDRSFLLNCHFDSVSNSPGATDDAISCAIMLELLNIFARIDSKLSKNHLIHDVIFLFNGGEENFLPASHGFITQHPWRHSIRAFINLEGAGAGGRELLFQAGPRSLWIVNSYIRKAPYPHCNVVAQELFQSGLIFSDTDFRIFNEIAHLPGADIAYIKNGYVYHTEFDRVVFVEVGALQRAGENLVAVIDEILQSPCFTSPCSDQETKMIFFDVVGLFTVRYSTSFGKILNFACAVVIVVVIWSQFRKRNRYLAGEMSEDGYSNREFAIATILHLLCSIFMAVAAYLMTFIVEFLNITMCWYGRQILIIPIYIAPTSIVGLLFHCLSKKGLEKLRLAKKLPPRDGLILERAFFDSALLIFSMFLLVFTWYNLDSSFVIFVHAALLLLRHAFTNIHGAFYGPVRQSRILFYYHLAAIFPVVFLGAYLTISFLKFILPMLGRTGPTINSEVVVALFSALCSILVMLYMAGLVYVSSRSVRYVLTYAFCVVVFMVAFLAFTSFGSPYRLDASPPRLRRLRIQHVSRKIYDVDGHLNSSENALWYQTLDYRGVKDLPSAVFLQGSSEPPCIEEDSFCALPYYYASVRLMPPKSSVWMAVPSPAVFEKPLRVARLSRTEVQPRVVRMNFSASGSNNMILFITPINNWTLAEWSLYETVTPKQTYYVFLSNVGDGATWDFSLTFQINDTNIHRSKDPIVLLGVASHYTHGPSQFSEQTRALISTIDYRRYSPATTFGHWKWFLTPEAFNSEYVAQYFS